MNTFTACAGWQWGAHLDLHLTTNSSYQVCSTTEPVFPHAVVWGGSQSARICVYSQPVAAVRVAARWLITVCAIRGQGTPPYTPPQLRYNLQIQPDSSSVHDAVWDVLLKCCEAWWAEELLNVFSCTTGIFCSDSIFKISFLPFLLSFCIPASSYLPCRGISCIS